MHRPGSPCIHSAKKNILNNEEKVGVFVFKTQKTDLANKYTFVSPRPFCRILQKVILSKWPRAIMEIDTETRT